jgi:hypothetical protein
MDGIISDQQAILNELLASKENGNQIGIWAPRLGEAIFMCTVETIVLNHGEDKNSMVIVQERNLQGENLEMHVIYLREIEKVHRFKTMVDN